MSTHDRSPALLEANIDFAKNPQPKCPVTIAFDLSGSMADDDKFDPMVSAFKESFLPSFALDILARMRVDLSLVGFNGVVRVIREFGPIDGLSPNFPRPSGLTALGRGILHSVDHTVNRLQQCQRLGIPLFRGMVVALTDGMPEGPGETAALHEQVRQRIRQVEEQKLLRVFLIGVDHADMDFLNRMSFRGAKLLRGFDFKALFEWLSVSLQNLSHSDPGNKDARVVAKVQWDS